MRIKPLLMMTLLAPIYLAAPSSTYAQAQKNPNAAKTSAPAAASVEPQAEKPAPYDQQLARLSEILGALQYIETLCNLPKPNDWRGDMAKLLAAEAISEPLRQERFTAAFNRGYRSFAAVYKDCTNNAKAAETSYRHEGATLAQEITSRFGN